MPWLGNECSCGAQSHGMVWSHPALWCGNKWAMMGTTPLQYYPHPMLWRGGQWLVPMQPHRGYTFDSPGLPTIGGYPGEQGVRDATPLGVVLSFYLRSPCNKNPPRGCEGEGFITDNGGCDGERWRAWPRTMEDMTADDGGRGHGQWKVWPQAMGEGRWIKRMDGKKL